MSELALAKTDLESFQITIKKDGQTLQLIWQGVWQSLKSSPIVNWALKRISDDGWNCLEVDCRDLKQLETYNLKSDFVASLVEVVRVAMARSANWRFLFDRREHIRVIDLCHLRPFCAGHLLFEEDKLTQPIIVSWPPPISAPQNYTPAMSE